jgi:hypothetical protein
MAERDTILAVLQSDIGLVGLVLTFAGFVVAKAESFSNIERGDRYRYLALASLVPIVAALVSAWISMNAIEGGIWSANHSLYSLKLVLALTGVYAIIAAALTFFP